MTAGCSSEGTPSERVTDSSATAQTSGATSSNGQGEVPAPLPSVAASDGVQPGSPGIEPSVAPSSAGDSAPLASSGPMTLEPVAPEPAVSEPAVPGPVTSEPVVPDPGTPPVAPDSGTPPVAPDPGTPSVAPDPGTPSVAPDSGFESSSAELIASFELGWNLGNSLDVPEGETAWNNPVVSRELLEAVAAAGFDVVRVPVTWSLFLGPGPEYSVDAARLTRVEEVLGYVLDSGMHAIVNLHHDGADGLEGVEWLSLNDPSGEVSDSHNAAVEAQFVAVWTQLAQHFGAYDSRLLFESMNEIHDGYDAPDPVYYDIINRLNQVFVDIVRASGGNNAARHLVVPGYNTNIDYTLEGFVLPTDTATDKLTLSVHFYDPWTFAGEGSTAVWGAGNPGADSWGQEDFVVTQFERLRSQYIEQGIPVVIGEYGATNVSGSENYRRYYMEYVTQAACQRGIVPIYWDNGGAGSGADNFALFDRVSGDVVFPDILDAMSRGCQSEAALDAIVGP